MNLNLRRPFFNRRMFGGEDLLNEMLIEPWISEAPFGRSFERDFMSSVLDILEPLALLDRMDRMITRWIGRRPGLIRKPFRFRRFRPTRRIRRIRRVPSRQRFVGQQPMQRRRRSVSVQRGVPWQQPRQIRRGIRRQSSVGRQVPIQSQPIRRRQWKQTQQFGQMGRQLPIRSTSRSVSRQRSGSRNVSLGRQVPIQSQMSIGRLQRKQNPQTQQFGQMGRQLPISSTSQSMGGQQNVSQQMSIGRKQRKQNPQTQQFGMGRQLPIPSTGRSMSGQQNVSRQGSLGRQVPIQSQSNVRQHQPRQQQSMQSTQCIGKLGKAAQAVTDVKLPQLYRICLDTQGGNLQDIKCNVQKSPTGQCNMLITGCGPYRRCYTLPAKCDHKRMKKHMLDNMLVIECPLLEETPRCLDINMQPQIKEDSVSVKVNIPEFIDPSKVQVNLRGNDLILRFETKCTMTECACRVHYYNKVTLPPQTNLDMLKCQCAKGCLLITAPIIGGKKQPKQQQFPVGQQPKQVKQPQIGAFGRQQQVSEQLPEKKMRHRKLLKLQQAQQQGMQIPQKGVQQKQKGLQIPQPSVQQQQPQQKQKGMQIPQTGVQQQKKQKGMQITQPGVQQQKQKDMQQISGVQQPKQKGVQQPTTKVSQKATKLPKPEEISIGREKQTPKKTPVTPTPSPQVAKPKKQKQQKQPTTETRVSGEQTQREVSAVKPSKKEKGQKGQQEGRITGAHQLHEIFASGTTQRQQDQPQGAQSTDRPVSPTKL